MDSAFVLLPHKLQEPRFILSSSTTVPPTPVNKMKHYVLKAIFFLK